MPVGKEDAAAVARELGPYHVVHLTNRAYSGNRKACYSEALARGGDIVVMLPHAYQFSLRLLPTIAAMVPSGHLRTRDQQPIHPTPAAEMLPKVRCL